MNQDTIYMQYALRLAARGLGHVWPNPSVGAVLVKEGVVIGCGVTARGGRPHAETQAIAMAGESARGATLYVTLEPCSHHGQTPPCAEAIIQAGITRVVSACEDSNPRVAGKGIAQLETAGIEVINGVCKEEARALNEGFFSLMERARPFVTLKMATSLDGKSATDAGHSQWITGEAARARGHLLRATHDAVLTGIGTVLADDPALTCRIAGREKDSPQRIILDSSLRTPLTAKALPAWIMTTEHALQTQAAKAQMLRERGCSIFPVTQEKGRLFLMEVLTQLGREGITRLLVEAGPQVSDAFATAGLVDRICWFRAPRVIGKALHLKDAAHYRHREAQRIGEDSEEWYDIMPSTSSLPQ